MKAAVDQLSTNRTNYQVCNSQLFQRGSTSVIIWSRILSLTFIMNMIKCKPLVFFKRIAHSTKKGYWSLKDHQYKIWQPVYELQLSCRNIFSRDWSTIFSSTFADYRIRAYNRLMSQLRRKTRCPLSIICILPLIMHSTATTPLVVLPRSRRERGRLPKKCTSHSSSWPWPWPCLASKVDFDHFCSFLYGFLSTSCICLRGRLDLIRWDVLQGCRDSSQLRWRLDRVRGSCHQWAFGCP